MFDMDALKARAAARLNAANVANVAKRLIQEPPISQLATLASSEANRAGSFRPIKAINRCCNARGDAEGTDKTDTRGGLSVLAVAPKGVCAKASAETAAPLPAANAPSMAPGAAVSDAWCWPQSGAMNGAEIDATVIRLQLFARHGIGEAQADELADLLVLRDRQLDDRRLCLECRSYRPGRCGNHRAARLHSPEVGRDLAALLQRCPGFQTAR